MFYEDSPKLLKRQIPDKKIKQEITWNQLRKLTIIAVERDIHIHEDQEVVEENQTENKSSQIHNTVRTVRRCENGSTKLKE